MSKLEERRQKQEKKGRQGKTYLKILIGGFVLLFITMIFVEQLFRPSACECAKLISRNGFITYGDLQFMKNFSNKSGSGYKEMEKTYNCGEWYDYDELKNCSIN